MFQIFKKGDYNMLSNEDFVYQSLIVNLFYLRTIREFCICIQLSFLIKNDEYIKIAQDLGIKAEEIGEQYLSFADGNISQDALDGDFIVTPYTLACEEMTERLFEVDLATHITEKELEIVPGYPENISEEAVSKLNEVNKKTLSLIQNFITFVTEIYNLEIENKIFSFLYPHLLKYMIEAAEGYQIALRRLVDFQNSDPTYVANFEYNYVITLMDTAMYIRGLVNPTSIDIFIKAQSFVIQFTHLSEEYKSAGLTPENQLILSSRTLELVERYSDFLANVIERVLTGEVYFIIEPIFLDNMYTEANYFKYVLKRFKEETSML